jgi:hypothetical protein
MNLLRKGLILLNIIIMLLSLCFLLMGGLFYCSTSYVAQLYGNISCAGSMILLVLVIIFNIPVKNNGRFPLIEFVNIIPIIVTILAILLASYNIKKYSDDIISNKANTNYYLFNGMYVLSLGFIIVSQILNLILNFFYNYTNINFNKLLKWFIIILTSVNGLFAYYSHKYINL